MTTSTKRPGELKPCPFCGGPADFIGEPHGYSVRCLHCLATSGPGDYGYQVTTKWNTRTPTNESPAPQADEDEAGAWADLRASGGIFPEAYAVAQSENVMTEDQIKHMVNRFLMWKLPRDTFNPDCGISFDKKPYNTHTAHPSQHEPSGTNLFDATQADAMVRYMIEGLLLPDNILPGSGNMDARFEWLQSKAIDMGYLLVPEGEHPDSPHAIPAPQPPVEGLRGPTPIKQLGWQETFVDRGDGATEQSGWEADNGFSSWYSIEQYFASDSYGWQVKFDCDVIGDFDDPDQAKACAQSHFETRILAALASPSLTAERNEIQSSDGGVEGHAQATAVYNGVKSPALDIAPEPSQSLCSEAGIKPGPSEAPPSAPDGIDHAAINRLREEAFKLSPAEQYRLAFFVAENVGYILEREPDHPDSPHTVPLSAPDVRRAIAWRYRDNDMLDDDWFVSENEPTADMWDVVEPLYTSSSHVALAQPVADREAIARVVRLLRTLNFNYRLNDCDDRPNDDALEMPMTVFREANAILALLSAQPAKGER